jgi:TolA-binding protein
LQQGIAWVNSENFEAAAKHFPEMLKRYPKHEKLARLVYYSGLALARQKQWEPAKGHFKRVVESFADSEFADQALYEWAWCERRSDRKPEAVKLYEKLLATHPASPLAVKVQSEMAELNSASGDQDKVIAQLTGALAQVKDESLRADIRYQLASAHFKKGDHATAAEQLEKLLVDYPESKLLASILFQAGESRLKLGETVAARGHFAKAAAVPESPESLAESITMRLAETHALTNQHAEAGETYTGFLEKFPKSKWIRNARFGLGFAMENAGNSDQAILEYRKLLGDKKVDLWTVRGRFQIGECYFNLQKYDEAVAEFVSVEINYRKYPSWQAKAVLEMARVLIAQDKKAQAAERLKEVIQRYPKEKAATVAQQYLDELRK